MLLGTYERAGVPWSPLTTPWDFAQSLLPNDLERIAPSLEVGFEHFPALGEVGIRKVVNGPFTFAPDGNPLVGPIRGLTNFWVACGVMAGFSSRGGVSDGARHFCSQIFAITFGNGGLAIVVRVVNGGFRLPEKK